MPIVNPASNRRGSFPRDSGGWRNPSEVILCISAQRFEMPCPVGHGSSCKKTCGYQTVLCARVKHADPFTPSKEMKVPDDPLPIYAVVCLLQTLIRCICE